MRRRSSDAIEFEPALASWPSCGVYQLWLRVSATWRGRVGRLGRVELPAGLYVYTGRAQRGLVARVTRHVVGSARRHWHIDYVLAGRSVAIERVVLAATDPAAECTANQHVAGAIAWAGFGASDCRAGCGAHLVRVSATEVSPEAADG
jgi:Uri superfamily endonuclease